METNEYIFIKRGSIKFNNKFDYSQINYINCDIPVKIICPIHGEFYQTPYNHYKTTKYGCPKCAIEINMKLKNQKLYEKFIKKSKIIHNDYYDYSFINFINMETPVKIICPIHGEFYQIPYVHYANGCGCQECAKLVRINKKTIIND
jgi:hypothetical protein